MHLPIIENYAVGWYNKRVIVEVVFLLVFLIAGFILGNLWQKRRSHLQLLVDEANLKTKQIQELEKVNKELETKNRELYSKELALTLANNHLQTLEGAKSKFVSVTTHQLRTPLAAIKWTLDMAAKGQLGAVTEEQKKYLLQGLISTNRVISIVNDLLKVDSIDTERAEYIFHPTDLVKLISNLIFEFTNQAMIKKINFLFLKPQNPIPMIELDADKVRMVLENLIDNAVKYTPEGGKVTIKISDERINSAESAVLVSVNDSGIGIPAGEADKVFEKFFRASNAIKKEPDGSGLGLFIARDIIEKHNGSIWFETHPGAGTTFSLTLPLHQKKV